MVDQRLIDRCIRKDPKAQYELYRALYGSMMAICSRYERNRDDALDRLNQGFLKILNNLDKRRPEVPFELWTRRIMINTVIDHHRHERQRQRLGPVRDAADEEHLYAVNEYLHHMEADALEAMLQQLPGMSRRVFNLFAIDGHSHAEIAAMLDISEGTSKWHVAHARKLLQRTIARLAGETAINTGSP